jgi:hypothetical protein
MRDVACRDVEGPLAHMSSMPAMKFTGAEELEAYTDRSFYGDVMMSPLGLGARVLSRPFCLHRLFDPALRRGGRVSR